MKKLQYVRLGLTLLQFVYFLRFQIIGWLFLVLFPAVTLCWIPFLPCLRSLLGGLFDLTNRDDSSLAEYIYILLFTYLTFSLAWTVLISSKLVLLYGTERFDLDLEQIESKSGGTSTKGVQQWFEWIKESKRFHLVSFFLSVFSCIPMLTALIQETHTTLPVFIPIVSGFIVFVLVLLCLDYVQRLFCFPKDAKKLRGFLFPFPESFFENAIKVTSYSRFLNPLFTFGNWLIKTMKPWFGRGYIRYRESGDESFENKSVFYTGHLIAFATFAAFCGIYGVGWFWTAEREYFPAIVYALILVVFLVLFSTAIAFFSDRFRFPSILCTLVLLFVSNGAGCVIDRFYNPHSIAYQYKVRPIEAEKINLRSPSTILNTVPEKNKGKPFAILVAADGGGIQAAGWGTTVLTGLEARCNKILRADRQGECARNIKLISSVSGGSVGAMYFLNGYEESGLSSTKLNGIVESATRSSIDSVGWGLVYPDLLRILGIPSKTGRGRALEESWERNAEKLENQDLVKWSGEEWRPAFIFNTTVVETGERMMISTSSFGEKIKGRKTFQELMEQTGEKCQKNDKKTNIKISTAARLSASFPFVTPTARSDMELFNSECDSFSGFSKHIADGGYFDNTGVLSLSEWLDEALSKSEVDNFPVKDILIVQIRSFRSSSGQPERSKSETFLQGYSPALTLLNIRTAAQRANADSRIKLLSEKWNNKKSGPRIQTVVFEYDCQKDEEPPLSWHLTKGEKEKIENCWSGYSEHREMKKFKEFIERTGEENN